MAHFAGDILSQSLSDPLIAHEIFIRLIAARAPYQEMVGGAHPT